MYHRIGTILHVLCGNIRDALNARWQTVFFRKIDKANDNPIKQTFTQKANDYPTEQTFTFEAVRCDCRKHEKPVPEMTPVRVALCLELLKTPWNQGVLGKKRTADISINICCLLWSRRVIRKCENTNKNHWKYYIFTAWTHGFLNKLRRNCHDKFYRRVLLR